MPVERDVTEAACVAAGVVSDELVAGVVADAAAGGVDLNRPGFIGVNRPGFIGDCFV